MAWLKFMARNRWHIGVLALALVLAQSIGLTHGIAHAPLLNDGLVAQAEFAPDNFVERLFGDHHDEDGSTQCRLFDQSNHLDGLTNVHALPLPTHLATIAVAAYAGLISVRWLAPFQARGPPFFR